MKLDSNITLLVGKCVFDGVKHDDKGENNPITGLDRPRGFREVEASRF